MVSEEIRKHLALKAIVVLFSMTAILSVSETYAQPPDSQPVVHGLLFWMEGCPHCEEVIHHVLPPIQEQYKSRLDIRLIEVVTVDDVHRLYEIASAYGISSENVAVPFLIIGEQVLIGAVQIPTELPGLIETGLAAGGVDQPIVPGLDPATIHEAPLPAQSSPTIVNGLLFSTPDCHECQLITRQVLELTRDTYRGQFSIEVVDVVTSEDAGDLYQVAEREGISKEDVDLPMLILGDHVLIGSEILTQLPALIEAYLPAGGTDHPATNPLDLSPLNTYAAAELSLKQLEGYWLAIASMVVMVAALVYVLVRIVYAFNTKGRPIPQPPWQAGSIPVLIFLGLGVAGYLAFVEINMIPAACGPVGGCDKVHSSPYANLFGVLPVGGLGFLGYITILLIWVYLRLHQIVNSRYAAPTLLGLTFLGTLFSLYLTYLEPFVINAICIWCLASAMIMTLLMLMSLNPMLHFLTEDKGGPIPTS